MTTIALALGVVTIAYALGRVRPLQRLNSAAWWRGISAIPRPSRFPAAWGLLWLLLNPRKTYYVWRRRNQPRRASAPVLLRTRPPSPTEQESSE